MRRGSFLVIGLFSAMLAGALSAGCETLPGVSCDNAPEDNPVQCYTGGLPPDRCRYQSTPWDHELLLFKGGTQYALQTGLSCSPEVQAYLSFDEFGTLEGGTLAQAAGDQVLIGDVNDTTHCGDAGASSILISNHTCSDYWLMVIASCPSCP
jgi:hypothetical protein